MNNKIQKEKEKLLIHIDLWLNNGDRVLFEKVVFLNQLPWSGMKLQWESYNNNDNKEIEYTYRFILDEDMYYDPHENYSIFHKIIKQNSAAPLCQYITYYSHGGFKILMERTSSEVIRQFKLKEKPEIAI